LHRCVKFHDTEYAVYGFDADTAAGFGLADADAAAAEGGTPARAAV